ncbi:MAG: motility associated factor glycosyltransferase family protein, partial [Lachnospiraceae bacterium]|nr:motility associated factor glycosyltransferase family protein [Lachnospiraceae bacterium]
VDTAIRKVLSKGIMPDAIISVDNSKLLENFMVDGIQDIFFFGDMSMNTDVLDLVKPSNLVFYSSDSPVWAKMFKEQGSEIFTVYSGGSVALDALTLSIILGFKRIILIGQDLALTGNRQYAHGGEISFDNIPGGIVYVEDIYGEEVPTKKDYFNFIKNFEQIAVTHPDVELIDATEGGARIEHTKIMTLQEAIDNYCSVECDIDSVLEEAPRLFVGDDETIICNKLLEMKNNIRNLGKRMSQVAADCKTAASMLSKKDYNVSKLKDINRKMEKLDESYVNMDEHVLIRKYVAIADYEFSGDVYIEGDDYIEESIRMYEKSEKLYSAIAKAAPDMVKIIDDCIEKIKNKNF